MTKTDNENIWKGYRKNKLNYSIVSGRYPLHSCWMEQGERGGRNLTDRKREIKEGGEAGLQRKVQ